MCCKVIVYINRFSISIEQYIQQKGKLLLQLSFLLLSI